MLNLKKTAVAVLVLGSSAVFAGSMGPVCSSVNVTIPCESTAWGFGAEALYLEPVNSTIANTMGANSTGRVQNLPNNYAWGFKLEGSYHYGTGSDTNLNWYHLSKSASRSKSVVDQLDLSTLGTLENQVATGTVDPKWDAVNLELGQNVNFGENKHIRFHGGAQYVRLTNTTTLNTYDTLVPTEVVSVSNNPTYNGFGPRLGTDMSYDWGNGLGIYANGAGAMLVGSSKMSNSTAVNTALLTYSAAHSASRTTLVPELEAKLGVKYDYAMAQGDLTLDVGWLWINYFNSQSDLINQNLQLSQTDSDFGVQGLYFGLKWLGNVA